MGAGGGKEGARCGGKLGGGGVRETRRASAEGVDAHAFAGAEAFGAFGAAEEVEVVEDTVEEVGEGSAGLGGEEFLTPDGLGHGLVTGVAVDLAGGAGDESDESEQADHEPEEDALGELTDEVAHVGDSTGGGGKARNPMIEM
jgi:hypothetical protein